jgi:type IV pilus assembly protein PilQ
MNKHSRWKLAAAAALLAVAATGVAGIAAAAAGAEGREPAAQLLDWRIVAGERGQIAVELVADGDLEYQSFVLEAPDRLVLDFTGVVSRLARSSEDVGAAGVVRVRAGQHALEPVPVTRVVFDLEQPLAHEIAEDGSVLTVSFAAGFPAPESGLAAAPTPSGAAAASDVPAAAGVADLIRELESRQPEGEARTSDEVRVLSPERVTALVAAAAPSVAAPQVLFQQAGSSSAAPTSGYETRTIVTDATSYSGKAISLNLVDADLKQVFRLFHEISGLNFVLDPSVTGRVTIVLDDVPWDQALDIILKNAGLDKVLEENVIRIASTQKLSQEAAQRKQLKEAKELEVEPITITRTLSYAKADEVERVIRDSGVLTPRGKVIVDERTNTLIVSDIPKKVDPLDTLISTLDAETPQVMIEARIVETSREFVQDLGVDWGFTAVADASKGTGTGLSFPANASATYGLSLPGNQTASALSFNFGNVIDSFTLDLTLYTLEREGYGRILSSPKVATQNNERAEIEQGIRIPIVNTTATEINVEFVSASLRMIVTPQITAEGTIILEVEVENNSPDFLQTAGGIPSINTQRAQTKVLIADGGTTVIGGIFVVNEGRSELGVPWFRKLPVFGWLFKTQNITNQNRELLIFITPRIMRLA